MTVRDHRCHHKWRSAILAIIWSVLCLAMVSAVQGSLAPPLFGVPLLLLALFAWRAARFTPLTHSA